MPWLGCALVLSAVLSCAPSVAEAQTTGFRQAQEAYVRGQFDEVVALLAPLIDGPNIAIRDEIVLQEARKLLGASYILTGDPDGGQRMFEELLRTVRNNGSPEALESFALDPAQYPQPVLDAFARIHTRMVDEMRDEQTTHAREQAEARERRREAMLSLVSMAEEAEHEIERDRGPTLVPFGGGQFYNENDDLGYVFLVSEVSLLVANLALGATFLGVWLDLPNDPVRGRQPQTIEQQNALNGLVLSTNLSAAALGALMIIGILEAQASFVPVVQVRQRREIPQNLLEELDLGLSPGGVTLRGRF